jgi:hypothetical protein
LLQLVLVPGAILEVVGVLRQGDLTMVQLNEIDTPLAFHEFSIPPAQKQVHGMCLLKCIFSSSIFTLDSA